MSGSILIGTRKGTIIIDNTASGWAVRPISHPGIPVCYAGCDSRTGTLWASLDHGHWGAKLSRSTDGGKSWVDANPIKFPKGARYIVKYLPTEDFDPNAPAAEPEYKEASVLKIWCLAFGGSDQPGRIYAGTIPGGLFVSDDNGESWELNRPLWNHESRGGDLFKGDATSDNQWGGTPASIDYGVFEPGIHSIVVDPSDSNHIYIAASTVGVMESKDGGQSWAACNKGLLMDYMPDPAAEWGHDPHFMTGCVKQPEHLWQQNHCGVFYSSDGAITWEKVSDTQNGVHFGFPIAVDENDGKTAWVVPAKADSERMAIDGGLCVARTTDGGQNWETLRKGLPQKNAYDIVLRHALDISGDRLCFASTTGNVYLSEDRGDSWVCLGNNLPPVYSVRFT